MIDKKIENFIVGRAPLLYLITEEEERVERMVSAAVKRVKEGPYRIFTWSCMTGLTTGEEVVDSSNDPAEGLAGFLQVPEPAVLIFKDFHLFVNDRPHLIRQIKECARSLRFRKRKIFFVCPRLVLPEELFPLFRVEDVPLPGYEELSRLLDLCVNQSRHKDTLQASLTPDLRDKMVRSAMGFTTSQAADAYHESFMNGGTITGKSVDMVVGQKEALVRRSGVLEFVDASAGSWEIGGLINLKKWLKERGGAFSAGAAKRGLTPKGILVMGVSGCGKSLCIKAIAAYWKLPLLRLDMGRIYDGLAGPPEEAMRKAIKTSEAMAPCVLWIDEIEAGIANQQQKAGGGKEARVLALFLTWMQEKTAPVFVGATANEVEVLPPEILRKGRFDELFYMGLPNTEERKQILTIHLRKRRIDPARFDLDYLASSTDALNGAEIEQGVISAIYESAANKTEVTEHVLANCLRNIVPLSRTMRERIQKIEAWARDRAMKASLETI